MGITGTFTGQATSPYYIFTAGTSTDYMYSSNSANTTASSNYYNLDGDYNSTFVKYCIYGRNSKSNMWVIRRLNTRKAFSFMAYNTLHIKTWISVHGNGGDVIWGVSTNSWLTSNSYNASVNDGGRGSSHEVTINVSSLGADCWIYLYQSAYDTGSKGTSGTDVYIYSIWATS